MSNPRSPVARFLARELALYLADQKALGRFAREVAGEADERHPWPELVSAQRWHASTRLIAAVLVANGVKEDPGDVNAEPHLPVAAVVNGHVVVVTYDTAAYQSRLTVIPPRMVTVVKGGAR